MLPAEMKGQGTIDDLMRDDGKLCGEIVFIFNFDGKVLAGQDISS